MGGALKYSREGIEVNIEMREASLYRSFSPLNAALTG